MFEFSINIEKMGSILSSPVLVHLEPYQLYYVMLNIPIEQSHAVRSQTGHMIAIAWPVNIAVDTDVSERLLEITNASKLYGIPRLSLVIAQGFTGAIVFVRAARHRGGECDTTSGTSSPHRTPLKCAVCRPHQTSSSLTSEVSQQHPGPIPQRIWKLRLS